MLDDSFRNLLGFHETILYKKDNLSSIPVVTLPFENTYLECDIAKGMIYKQKRSGKTHNWTMTVNLGYKYVESFAGGLSYMTETKDVIQIILSKQKLKKKRLSITQWSTHLL